MAPTRHNDRRRHHSRQLVLLQLIVEAYIESGQPVGSTMLAARHPDVNLSPASIRAAMAALTREGLITQPHVSAGRIPTEAGLRAYLDDLVYPRLRPWDRTRLEATAHTADAWAFVAGLGQALSALAGQVAVVAAPQFVGARLREIGLVRLGDCRILAYFVSLGGQVQQKVVQVDANPAPEALQALQNALNSQLAHSSLAQLRRFLRQELSLAEKSCDEARRRSALLGQQLLPRPGLHVIVEGTEKVLEQPEFADVNTLRALLTTLAQKQRVLDLMAGVLANAGVQVLLGSEHALAELRDVACVGCAWSGADDDRAAVTLWGPRRMDYGRLMPLVGHASYMLGRFWEQA